VNNKFDQLAIYLARFLHNYKKTPFNARVGSLDSGTSSELIWKGYHWKVSGLHSVAETWRRVWGDAKIFRGPRFL